MTAITSIQLKNSFINLSTFALLIGLKARDVNFIRRKMRVYIAGNAISDTNERMNVPVLKAMVTAAMVVRMPLFTMNVLNVELTSIKDDIAHHIHSGPK